MELINIKVKTDQKCRLDTLKVHDRQAYHEIIEMLLDEHEKLNTALCNDCR